MSKDSEGRKKAAEACHENVKQGLSGVGELGRRLISESLVSSADPFSTIFQLQQQLSLGANDGAVWPALDFLEVLACPRPTSYSHIFLSIKSEMEATIEGLDEQALLLLLKETIAFMSVEELKSVPILVVKKLGTRVPESYLNYLKGKNLLGNLPIEVRRQAWQSNRDAFIEAIKPACSTAFKQVKDKGRADPTSVEELVSSIGQSEILFSVFANHCGRMATLEGGETGTGTGSGLVAFHWGSVVRSVLVGMEAKSMKIAALGKLHELAQLLETCRRQGRVDRATLHKVVEFLVHLLVNQANALEKTLGLMGKNRGASATAVAVAPAKRAYTQRASSSSSSSFAYLDGGSGAGGKTYSAERKTSHYRRVPTDPPQSVIQPVIEEAWHFMDEADTWCLFATPVSDEFAPNYSKIITWPMDLATMRGYVDRRMYHNLEAFEAGMFIHFNRYCLYLLSLCPDYLTFISPSQTS